MPLSIERKKCHTCGGQLALAPGEIVDRLKRPQYEEDRKALERQFLGYCSEDCEKLDDLLRAKQKATFLGIVAD